MCHVARKKRTVNEAVNASFTTCVCVIVLLMYMVPHVTHMNAFNMELREKSHLWWLAVLVFLNIFLMICTYNKFALHIYIYVQTMCGSR